MGLINKNSRKLPLFSLHHRPHTHSWDFSPFTEAQRAQPSPFDHRTHTLYGRTGLYIFMALLTKFLGNYHSFHRITAPTHILGTLPLSLRHNEPNPVRSTTGHTPLNGLKFAQLSNFLTHLLLDKCSIGNDPVLRPP